MLPRKVFVIGAHPDDLEMNAGGTIRKMVRAEIEVRSVVMCFSSQKRIAESLKAQRILGVTDPGHMGGKDTELYSDKAQLIRSLEDILKTYEPDTVITHFHSDTHQDHAATNEIVMAAARYVPNILLFKPVFPSGRTDIPFHPTMISRLDLCDMDAKMEAMKAFESQLKKYGEDQWLTSLRATAAGDAWTYGGFHGYAELFQISRMVI